MSGIDKVAIKPLQRHWQDGENYGHPLNTLNCEKLSMKQHVGIIILITIVTVLLVGVSTAESAVLNKQNIVSTFSVSLLEKSVDAYELSWADTKIINGQIHYFFTLHENQDAGKTQIFRAYYRNKTGFVLLKELSSNQSEFLKPIVFRTKAANSPALHYVLRMTEIFDGTAHIKKEHLYLLSGQEKFQAIRFNSASEYLKTRIKKTEGIWKSAHNKFSDDELSYEIDIWNKDDANCCPSGGKIVGHYQLEKINNVFQITVKDYKRK